MDFSLVIPSFIAGILTFLAPCTLPLVPGYLGFISGVSLEDLKKSPEEAMGIRRKVFINGVFYVVGFSAVFVTMGSLFGLIGSSFSQYRVLMSQIGGGFVIIFGLYMIGVLKLSFLSALGKQKRLNFASKLKPGNPVSSFIFGASFAFGWTPCVGPVLGSVLILASASATVLQGAFLLSIFALGLAIPFLIIAAAIQSSSRYLNKMLKYLKMISIIGGIFLIAMGVLMVTNRFGLWLSYSYQLFDFIDYDKLLKFL